MKRLAQLLPTSSYGRIMLVMLVLSLLSWGLILSYPLHHEQGLVDYYLHLGFYPRALDFRHTPWGILSYPWLHPSPMNLGANLLLLYGLGQLYERYYPSAHFLQIFVFGSIAGALSYALIASLLGPAYSFDLSYPLYGASAGICALAFALGLRHYRLSIKLGEWRVNFLLLSLLIYIITVFLRGDNYGGMCAHLGGALYGLALGLWQRRAKPREHKDVDREHEERRAEALRKLEESGYNSLSPEEQALI